MGTEYTLAQYEAFAMANEITAKCPACTHGLIKMTVAVIIRPEWDGEECDTVPCVAAIPWDPKATCFCKLTPQEFERLREHGLEVANKLFDDAFPVTIKRFDEWGEATDGQA